MNGLNRHVSKSPHKNERPRRQAGPFAEHGIGWLWRASEAPGVVRQPPNAGIPLTYGIGAGERSAQTGMGETTTPVLRRARACVYGKRLTRLAQRALRFELAAGAAYDLPLLRVEPLPDFLGRLVPFPPLAGDGGGRRGVSRCRQMAQKPVDTKVADDAQQS
jgi:hypothetical protein